MIYTYNWSYDNDCWMDGEGNVISKKEVPFIKKWVKMDAWRGYNSVTPKNKKHWKAISSDWMTGNWDDAGEHASDVVEAKINKLEQEHGSIAIVTTPTSNVFSVGYDVFIKNNIDKHE